MSTFQLKNYQDRCLDVLRDYLRRARETGARAAFNERPQLPVKYREVGALPGLPYVCMRVPTGGGKTLLAAYSVGIAGREFLSADRCTVLWLAPTNAIVDQTMRALKSRTHPYRQALDADFGGDVEVLSIEEALRVTRGVLDGATTVIVSTLAALRVKDTEGRHVYESNGNLQVHFSGLSEAQLAVIEKTEEGVPIFSLANVLRLRRPLVIMDEAHNARTPLSFETLERLSPSCILEFTATPDEEQSPSNVLVSVSAAELKAEQMVKLPIRLVSRDQWREAVAGAVVKQRQLENLAKQEQGATGEYIRPIVLFQAQPKSEDQRNITVEVLRKSLMDDFNIPADEIAEGTGHKWELPDDLMAPGPVRFVLTVSKLREGWDCPFAYVLCSVSNLSTKGAVEQILGRVLRLPRASAKTHSELNRAYAFATSAQFMEAANGLREALVESGFERFEARQYIEPDPELPFEATLGPLFGQPITELLSEAPELSTLPADLRQKLNVEQVVAPQGIVVKLTYNGPPLANDDAGALKAACGKAEDHVAVERLVRRSRGQAACPAAMGQSIAVPMLALRFGEQLEIFEDQFRDVPWDLETCDAQLTERDFNVERVGQLAEVDVDQAGKIKVDFVRELHEQLSFNDLRGPKTTSELVAWLDRNIDRTDRRYATQAQIVLYLRRVVDYLEQQRRLPLEEVVAARFRLRDALVARMHAHLAQSHKAAFQRMLLAAGASELAVDPEICFSYPATQYPADRFYEGTYGFPKHYYEKPGQMGSEEADCAMLFEMMPEVECWVRNLVRKQECSFWLPTSTDKFYPDFVARLRDGRLLVVEYKGKDRKDSIDTAEKAQIGEVWEAKSNGRCIFKMVGVDDYQEKLRVAVRSTGAVRSGL